MIVTYPNVPQQAVGPPTIAEDEPFRMLEFAHFETRDGAETFGKAFHGYILPGLLEADELAAEVAKQEGLPVTWQTLEGTDLAQYRQDKVTLTREPDDWHPYGIDSADDLPDYDEDDRQVASNSLDWEL